MDDEIQVNVCCATLPQVEAAFVTFNNEESASRCMEDYRDSRSWLKLQFQAPPLKFRGKHPLTVIPAPEPTDVMWENVSITDDQRSVRQAIVYAIMVVILCFSVSATVAVGASAAALQASGPTPAQCHSDLPAIAYGTLAFPEDTRIHYNHTTGVSCPSGTHSLRYYSQQARAYVSRDNAFGTCVSPHNTTLLTTPVSVNGTTASYTAGSLVPCFCFQEWESAPGFIAGYLRMKTSLSGICGHIADKQIISKLLTWLSSVIVVVINISLTVALKHVTTLERHLSISDELKHTSIKLFVAQFLNTAFLIQVVNTTPPSFAPSWLKSVMRGSASLWSVDWYSSAGAAIATTMLFQGVAIVVTPSVQRVIATFRQRRAAKRAMSQASLDAAIAAKPFAIAPRIALMLNIVFVTMTYSAALPVLFPIAAFNMFLQFWFDKVRHCDCCSAAADVWKCQGAFHVLTCFHSQV